jgi:hypothetical protein
VNLVLRSAIIPFEKVFGFPATASHPALHGGRRS